MTPLLSLQVHVVTMSQVDREMADGLSPTCNLNPSTSSQPHLCTNTNENCIQVPQGLEAGGDISFAKHGFPSKDDPRSAKKRNLD